METCIALPACSVPLSVHRAWMVGELPTSVVLVEKPWDVERMSTAADFFKIKPKKLTHREKLSAQTTKEVKRFLDTCAKDKMFLLWLVTGGHHHFRLLTTKAFRGYLVSDQMIDQMFAFLVDLAGPDPKRQFEELQRAELVALKLDRLQGLARFITSEAHLDEVLDRWVAGDKEKAAIRSQLLIFWKSQGKAH